MASTLFKTSSALLEISSRLPMGVATTKSKGIP
jgi:hypothetical protein